MAETRDLAIENTELRAENARLREKLAEARAARLADAVNRAMARDQLGLNCRASVGMSEHEGDLEKALKCETWQDYDKAFGAQLANPRNNDHEQDGA